MEKYRSCFGGNLGSSSRNTSLYSSRMGNYSMHCSLSESMFWMFATKNLHPFLMHFFACKAVICLTKTFFGMPWTFTWLPRLLVHKIVLCKQSSMTWFCSNNSMPISTLYNPNGRMSRFTFVRKPFKFTPKSLKIYKTFRFVPMSNWNNQGFSCFSFPSLHISTISGAT